MKLKIEATCLSCEVAAIFDIESDGHPGLIKDLPNAIHKAILDGGWVTDEWEYYCCEDCMNDPEYDPRTEALTIGERNPGLAGRYD